MRQHGRRYINQHAKHMADSRAIEMDAMVYDVDPSTRKCRVTIQNGIDGSGNTVFIVCDYPEGYQQTPFFLKPGQAVRIQRKGGIKGRMEVIGIGQTVPTNVTLPGIAQSADAILTGLRVLALPST